SVPEIFFQLFVIDRKYNNMYLKLQTEIIQKRVWEKPIKLHVELPCMSLRRHQSMHLYFQSQHTIDCLFISLLTIYMTPDLKGGNQHYTEIMKRRDTSLRYLQLGHLFKKEILFGCTKHCKNIYMYNWS
ncbi:hypothetical protein HZS_3659, partial [Henneguya salminicola]